MAPTSTQGAGRLPRPALPLIGRHAELAPLVATFADPDARLLTLTGPPGVGKTRLALAVAAEAAPRFADGVVFVDLAPVQDPGLVLGQVARALGLPDAPGGRVAARVIDALVDKEVLLVVDNCEQVLAAGLDLTEPLRACPGLRLLVTSRERLHLAAEREFPVAPLAVPQLRRRRRSRPPGRGARGRDARRAGALRAARLRGDGGQRAGRHGDLPTARRPPPRPGAGRRAGEALHPRRARRPAARPHGGADDQHPRRARPAPHAARRPRVELRPARRARAHALPQALGLRRRAGRWTPPSRCAATGTPTCWTSWARCWTRAWCAGPPRAAWPSSSSSRACAQYAAELLAADGDAGATRDRHAAHFTEAAVAMEAAIGLPAESEWWSGAIGLG